MNNFLQQEIDSYHDSLTVCKCKSCKSEVTNPREVIFFEAKTKNYISKITKTKKVLCHKCAKKISLNASISSFKYGIWGFPIGLLFCLFAVMVNMFNGIKPKKTNYRILYRNILYFASKKDFGRALFLTKQAKKFATTDFQKLSLNNIEKNIGEVKYKHKNRWNYTHLILHLTCYIVVIISFAIGVIGFKYAINHFNKNKTEIEKVEKLNNLHFGDYRLIDIPVDADGNYFYVNQPHIDLYKRPDKLSQISARIHEMEFVRVTGLIPNHKWVRVITENGYEGYMHKDYLEQYVSSETKNFINHKKLKRKEIKTEDIKSNSHPKFL